MRFASIAWPFAGWRLPHSSPQASPASRRAVPRGMWSRPRHPREPHRRVWAAHLLPCCHVAHRAEDNLWKSPVPSFDDRTVNAGYVPGHGLPRRHPTRHRQRPTLRRRRPSSPATCAVTATSSRGPTRAFLRGRSSFADATFVTDPQWPGSREASAPWLPRQRQRSNTGTDPKPNPCVCRAASRQRVAGQPR